MNELIKKFGEEAKSKVPHGLNVENWVNNYNEQYAKLIVEHCISLIRESMDNSEQSDLVYNAMLVDVISKINNAFFQKKFAAAFEAAFKDGIDLSGRDTP
jgi:hypothetical protein